MNADPLYQRVAELLNELGWRSMCDAQHTNLRDALPQIAAMLAPPVTEETLRDRFAAKAMQAMVTKSSGQDSIGGAKGVPLIAKYAYEFADAMLDVRGAT
jgi:hypothetical protein